MSTKIVAKAVNGMVKQSPFQTDLFDFKYIEDQVKAIKASMKEISEEETNEASENNEQDINDILNNQLEILHNIQYLLTEIENNTKKKKGWFNSKEK